MNNQQNLIDRTKLLKAIAEEKAKQEEGKERVGFGHLYWEFHEGAVTILEWLEKEINNGKFTPDKEGKV